MSLHKTIMTKLYDIMTKFYIMLYDIYEQHSPASHVCSQ